MGSDRVKGCATKANLEAALLIPGAHPHMRNFSVKVVARILRRILVTLYIYICKKSQREYNSVFASLATLARSQLSQFSIEQT